MFFPMLETFGKSEQTSTSFFNYQSLVVIIYQKVVQQSFCILSLILENQNAQSQEEIKMVKQLLVSISNLEANLNFTFCRNGPIIVPSCFIRNGYKQEIKGIPCITLLVIFRKNIRNFYVDIILTNMSTIQFILDYQLRTIGKKYFSG